MIESHWKVVYHTTPLSQQLLTGCKRALPSRNPLALENENKLTSPLCIKTGSRCRQLTTDRQVAYFCNRTSNSIVWDRQHKWHELRCIDQHIHHLHGHACAHKVYVHLVQVPACVQHDVACIYKMSEGITAQNNSTLPYSIMFYKLPIPSRGRWTWDLL